MPVPGYQEFMLPLLRLIARNGPTRSTDYYEMIADEFGLIPEDRQELLPSGTQAVYKNRIGWAGTYLTKAGLLDRPKKGTLAITPLGEEVLQGSPAHIDQAYLMRFDDFRAFQNQKPEKSVAVIPIPNPISAALELSPEEQLLESYRQLRKSIADELLERIKAAPPTFFEQLVVDLLVKMGYGGSQDDAGRAIGKSGDGGIDGIIKEDRLGLDFVYIQAKRWESAVGRPEIQGFAGSLEGRRARKGVFITTSSFTNNALEYVNMIEKRIVLINGEELANLMLDYGIGVTEVASYKVHRIDPSYFGDE